MKGKNIDNIALQMSDKDNVATAIADLEQEIELAVEGNSITVAESIPFGHKLALEPIGPGEEIYKYGEVIGTATERIQPGDWVHVHNCESTRGRGDINEADTEPGDAR